MNRAKVSFAITLTLGVLPAHADSMPQLDFGNKLLTAQVIWGAIIFAAFYYLVSRVGLPRVTSILDMRADTIAQDLNQARDARANADTAVAELTQARAKAYAQSQAAIADATQKARENAAARAAAHESELEAKLAESEARIHQAQKAAMGALREVASQTALAIVGRLTGQAADTGRVDHAVSTILGERGLDQTA